MPTHTLRERPGLLAAGALIITLGTTGLIGCSAPSGSSDSTPSPNTAAPVSLTYYDDIKPLLDRSCVRCHSGNGVGPGDFTQYDTVAPMATAISAYVGAGLMPPVAAEPGCQPYQGGERMFLSDEERGRIQAWVEGGAQEGTPATQESALAQVPHLEGANLEIRLPNPYQPQFDATGNEYVCFAVPNPIGKDSYVTGYDVLLDKGELLHHMTVYIDLDGGSLEAYGSDPFKCFWEEPNPDLNRIRKDWRALGGWVPGQMPIDYGDEVGQPIPAGASIVFEMHYYEAFEGAHLMADQSGLQARIKDQVKEVVRWREASSYDFRIPAGDEAHIEPVSTDYPNPQGQPEGVDIIGTAPHMHLLGSYAKLWIEHADGTKSCLSDGPYDFRNQLTYQFEEPVRWMPGDTVKGECHWNNSTSNPNLYYDPPIDIVYGDGTDDEMCILYFLTTEPI